MCTMRRTISKRIYKEAWANQRSADFLAEQGGKMFDPEMARAFGELLGKSEGAAHIDSEISEPR